MENIRDIQIPGPHGRPILVDVMYKPGREARPVIILCHGFKGFKDWGPFNAVAKYFAEKKFVFVKFNFSFNGTTVSAPDEFKDLEAFGNNNFSKELDDLGAVIDWVTQTALIPETVKNVNEIYLIGHSRGGSIAILKAAEDDRIKRLATWAAVSDLAYAWNNDIIQNWQKKGVLKAENSRTKQQMPLYYQLYEDYIANKERLDVPANAAKLMIPYIIVHGTEDSSVSFDHAIQLKRFSPNAKLDLIPNANHTFSTYHPWLELVLPFDMQIIMEHTLEYFKKSF